jgi:hypothetical protein
MKPVSSVLLIPLWPNLGLSDFHLFVVIKWKTDGSELGCAKETVCEVTGITSFISYIALADVYREWEQGQHKCVGMEGDYID